MTSQDGVFNREELDETFSGVTRLLFQTRPTECYAFHPLLKDALRAFVDRWQNPETGCWGQWMVDREGKVWKMDDMGMTFHVISDLKAKCNTKTGSLDACCNSTALISPQVSCSTAIMRTI